MIQFQSINLSSGSPPQTQTTFKQTPSLTFQKKYDTVSFKASKKPDTPECFQEYKLVSNVKKPEILKQNPVIDLPGEPKLKDVVKSILTSKDGSRWQLVQLKSLANHGDPVITKEVMNELLEYIQCDARRKISNDPSITNINLGIEAGLTKPLAEKYFTPKLSDKKRISGNIFERISYEWNRAKDATFDKLSSQILFGEPGVMVRVARKDYLEVAKDLLFKDKNYFSPWKDGVGTSFALLITKNRALSFIAEYGNYKNDSETLIKYVMKQGECSDMTGKAQDILGAFIEQAQEDLTQMKRIHSDESTIEAQEQLIDKMSAVL